MKNYFLNNELGEKIWNDKYRFDNETQEESVDRIVNEFYRIECKYKELNPDAKTLTREEIFELFEGFNRIIPGGSVLSGVGTNKKVSYSNCFVASSPDDNMESIFNTGLEIANISKSRGGVGININNLRPRDARVNNSAETSTGTVSFMDVYNSVFKTIGQNNRRAAGMICLSCKHPDLVEFINKKATDLTSVTSANISVQIHDDFMTAVLNNESYLLRFPIDLDVSNIETSTLEFNKLIKVDNDKQHYVKLINAKEVWDLLIENNWKSGEPGILFWDNHLNNDMSAKYQELKPVATNPCQPSWALVLTKNGIRQFNDVSIGDEIWSSEGWTKIVNKQNTGVKEVYHYETTAGNFYGTSNHKIISNGKKIEVDSAKSIDILKGFVEKSDINYQDVIDGLVIGDGNVYKPNTSIIYLCINKKDDDYLSDVNLKPYIAKRRSAIKNNAWEVVTKITAEELPLPHLRCIPERYFYGSQDKIKGLLKGLYSANGSITSKKIILTVSSKKLRCEVQTLLSSIGIRSYYTTHKIKNDNSNNEDRSCKETYDIIISSDKQLFYDEVGFLQNYKIQKLKSILSDIKNDIKTHEIISKKLISTEDVYSITVDNSTHTYWTSGVNVANCGEIALSQGDSCRLMSMCLPYYVKNPFTKEAHFDFELFNSDVSKVIRLADDLVDLEIEQVRKMIDKGLTPSEEKWWLKTIDLAEKGRRVGVGVTGLFDCVAMIGNNSKILDLVKTIMSQFDATLRKNSIFLGNERGNFKLFTPTSTEPSLRNVSYSTIAPTGSISILANNCSSGIEPIFALRYLRRIKLNSDTDVYDFIDIDGEKYKNNYVLHNYFVKEHSIKNNLSFEDAYKHLQSLDSEEFEKVVACSNYHSCIVENLSINDRLEIQSICQKYITHSISSTINLSNDATKEDINNIYLKAWNNNLKGVTVYRDGSRGGVLITLNKSTDKVITQTRPEKLKCTIKRFTNGSEKWIAFIGLNNDKPYEIFTGINDLEAFPVPVYVDEGVITKTSDDNGSRYDFTYKDHYNEDVTIRGLSRVFDKEYWNYARLISSFLRYELPISNIINIINKMIFDNENINSWKNGVIRSLSTYIPDGTESKEVCPDCNNKLRFENGCAMCPSCGYQKCG